MPAFPHWLESCHMAPPAACESGKDCVWHGVLPPEQDIDSLNKKAGIGPWKGSVVCYIGCHHCVPVIVLPVFFTFSCSSKI